jgi:hypothetical protein
VLVLLLYNFESTIKSTIIAMLSEDYLAGGGVLILERDGWQKVPDAHLVVGAACHETEAVWLGVHTQDWHVRMLYPSDYSRLHFVIMRN